MGQEPGEIRQEIEQTRAQMGETLEAVGQRADVKKRAKEAVTEKVDSAKGKAVQNVGRAEGKAKQGAEKVSTIVRENPLGLALGGVAAGFLAGLAAPSTRMEQEKLGPVAEQVKEEAKKTGQEALERGKQVGEEAAHSAAQTAKEQGRREGEELAGHARQRGQEVASRTPG